MHIVHKIALDPNNKQKTYFKKASGCARFAYNWTLAEWRSQYEVGGQPSEINLRRYLNSIKEDKYPWMLEVTKNAVQQAVKNAGKAFQNFFARLKSKAKKAGYPRFKKKGLHDSFRADAGPQTKGEDAVRVDGKYVILPIIGRIKLFERLRFIGQVMSAIVSRTGGRWFVALTVVVPDQTLLRKNHGNIDIDLGITAQTTSISDAFIPIPVKTTAPKPLKVLEKTRARLQRILARRLRYSKNWYDAKIRLCKLENHIANIRLDDLHKLTTAFVQNCKAICLESLNVTGMLANHCLAKAISDIGFGRFKSFIEYKALQYATTVVLVQRFFPSTKKCHCCGTVRPDLTLKDREWNCHYCGVTHDRDINAALNLLIYLLVPAVHREVTPEEYTALVEGTLTSAYRSTLSRESDTMIIPEIGCTILGNSG